MRACEGCRRRKIKCDATTTNQWPCASCVRQKCNQSEVDYCNVFSPDVGEPRLSETLPLKTPESSRLPGRRAGLAFAKNSHSDWGGLDFQNELFSFNDTLESEPSSRYPVGMRCKHNMLIKACPLGCGHIFNPPPDGF